MKVVYTMLMLIKLSYLAMHTLFWDIHTLQSLKYASLDLNMQSTMFFDATQQVNIN